MPERGAPGLREVLVVAAVVVVAILAVMVVTSVVPRLRDALDQFPILIAVLVLGTVGILWLIAVRRPPEA